MNINKKNTKSIIAEKMTNQEIFATVKESFGIEVRDENDIAAAMQLADKAVEAKGYFMLEWSENAGVYYCEIAFDGDNGFDEAPTAAEAISRAALAAGQQAEE